MAIGRLRLLDARTGSYEELRPGRAGLLRVCGHLPPDSTRPVDGLRLLLVADVLGRVAEMRGLQVLTALAIAGDVAGSLAVAERAATALGVHPPATNAFDGPADVHLVTFDAGADDARSGLVVRVAPADARLGDLGSAGHDPLAVRLALLSFPYNEAADLAEHAHAAAEGMLSVWRQQVTLWAESPSRPVPASVREATRTALDDLDTTAVITLLENLVLDADVPPGAKFEAFVYNDRVLGLDLARDIGRRSGG